MIDIIKYNNILPFLQKTWLRIGIIFILGFILLQEDMNLSLTLKSTFGGSSTSHSSESPLLPQNETESILIPDVSDLPTYKGELARIPEEIREAYIRRFSHVAVGEMKKYGIPASIVLANALLHSEAGTRDLSIKGNNHFAIPCTLDWLSISGMYQGDCYRHFDNAWMSYRNHSVYLTSEKFTHLNNLSISKYKTWAEELERGNYSNYKDLATELIKLIESYDLTRFDTK